MESVAHSTSLMLNISLMKTHRLPLPVAAGIAVSFCLGILNHARAEFLPLPSKVTLMTISTHPDDEGIFFGGVMPYYTEVANVSTVLVSVTSGEYAGSVLWRPDEERFIREGELKNAAEYYGLDYEPIFGRFVDGGGNDTPDVYDWDRYATDDIHTRGSGNPVEFLAEQIRLLKPEVVITHDFDGEYGHGDHKACAAAVAEAYDMAADPEIDLGGAAPWTAKKLYVHQSEKNGLGSDGRVFENWLFHDYMEETSIDTDGEGTPDATPRERADAALDEHVTQGSPDVSTVYRTDDNYDGHHSEWWGLYRSTVGPDTLVEPFVIEGTTYTDWAIGDFFENIELTSITGDLNGDGFVGSGDLDIVRANWGAAVTPGDLLSGDPSGDGTVGSADLDIVRAAWGQTAAATVPEPAAGLLLLGILLGSFGRSVSATNSSAK